MTREEFEALLADYLGDELNAADRAQFTAYLADHPEARREADELQATLDELARLQTVAMPAALPEFAARTQRAASPRWRFVRGLAKVAALVVFGVVIGRVTAPAAPQAPAGPALKENTALVSAVHPGWIELVEHLDANRGSLGAQLRVLGHLPR